MLLENKYYNTENVETTASGAVFHIRLIRDCNVYDGHFPGNPVCPGACSIETVRECASHLAGADLRISEIRKCRLTAVATPDGCSEQDVVIDMLPSADGFVVTARMKDRERTYMEFKGTMKHDRDGNHTATEHGTEGDVKGL